MLIRTIEELKSAIPHDEHSQKWCEAEVALQRLAQALQNAHRAGIFVQLSQSEPESLPVLEAPLSSFSKGV